MAAACFFIFIMACAPLTPAAAASRPPSSKTHAQAARQRGKKRGGATRKERAPDVVAAQPWPPIVMALTGSACRAHRTGAVTGRQSDRRRHDSPQDRRLWRRWPGVEKQQQKTAVSAGAVPCCWYV